MALLKWYTRDMTRMVSRRMSESFVVKWKR